MRDTSRRTCKLASLLERLAGLDLASDDMLSLKLGRQRRAAAADGST